MKLKRRSKWRKTITLVKGRRIHSARIVKRRRIAFECLEQRRVLASFYENAGNLILDIEQAGQVVSAVSNGDRYELTLTSGSWAGIDSTAVTGSGTSTLSVSSTGLASQSRVRLIDSAADVSIQFNNSGANHYAHSFEIVLDQSSGGEISFFGNTSFTGAAGLSVDTNGRIEISGLGTALELLDGNLSLSANEQLVPSNFNAPGITIDRGRVNISGSGSLELFGRGGGTGQNADGRLSGIYIVNGGSVTGGTSLPTHIKGIGGVSTGRYNHGVHLNLPGESGESVISSRGGNVVVEGYGGGVGTAGYNQGVVIQHGSVVSAGGNGSVTVTGTGGLSDGPYDLGVSVSSYVYGEGRITSAGGDVVVKGTGSGVANTSSAKNYGVEVIYGGEITAGGSGSVSVEGTGGLGVGDKNHGIYVWNASPLDNSPSRIHSASGSISITGFGGGTQTSAENSGVVIAKGGLIEGASNSLLEVQGFGGSGSGDEHQGVLVHGIYSADLRSTISSFGGDIVIHGNGGGIGLSAYNRGVSVFNGGRIEAGTLGAIDITGIGGNSDGPFNLGVSVSSYLGDVGEIKTSGADISITGTGVGSAASTSRRNYGVEVAFGGEINTSGVGAITIEGIGGSGDGDFNHGVFIWESNPLTGEVSQVKADSGTVTISGSGGERIGSTRNDGLRLRDAGKVHSNGNVIVNTTSIDSESSSFGMHLLGPEVSITAGLDAVLEINTNTAKFDNNPTDLSAGEIVFNATNLISEINGSSPELSYNQIDLNGVVSFNDVSLRLLGEHTGQGDFVLISNDSVEPFVGGLKYFGSDVILGEGGLLSFNGTTFLATYVGGDGNDFEIRAINLPPEIDDIIGLNSTEDSGLQTVQLSGIAAGNIESQPLRVTASSSDPELITALDVTYQSPNTIGELSFIPGDDRFGTATITVSVEDGGLDRDLSTNSDNATSSVTFSVIISPSPSVAVNDFASFPFEAPSERILTKEALLANDTLGNGESLDTVTITADSTSTSGGTISVDGDQLTYRRPASWFSGLDTFSYTLNDGGSTSTATVSILSGLQGDSLTITLEPGRDHEVTLQYFDDLLVMLDHVTQETLLNIPRELVPANIDVIGAPANSNNVIFSELSGSEPSESSTSWSYLGGSANDKLTVLGTGSQWAWLSSDPQVANDVIVDVRLLTTLIDSYTMIAVERVSVRQVDRVEISDPYLQVKDSAFELSSNQPFNLPNSTTLSGGGIISQTPVGLHTAESVIGRGQIDAVFTGGVGSLIRATGDLVIGSASDSDGFRSDGRLEVGVNTVTLLDTNQASLGELTTLGDGISHGTLISDHGIAISFTGNVEGYGTIQTDADGTVINNGNIIGTSSEQPITINSRVKGVGTFDNVVMNGEFTPGFSPALWTSGTVAYTDLNRFVIELGGRLAGAEFDRVEHYLAKLGGTLDVQLIDGFKPSLGDLFEVITSEQPFEGDFSQILLPLEENGVRIRELLGQHGIELETVFDVADTLEVLKSQIADYQIAGHDGSGLKVQGDRFRAFVTSLHQFVAEHPWHTQQLELEAGKLVQLATDGVNYLIIEGSNWKNFVEPSDVNNDKHVTALDALTVINELGRRSHSADLTSELIDAAILVTGEGHFYDQNGDGKCTALDALRVINDLARSSVSGEGEAVTADYLPGGSDAVWSHDAESYEDPFESEFKETDVIYSDADPETSHASDRPEDLVYATVGQESTEAVDSLLSDLEDWWK